MKSTLFQDLIVTSKIYSYLIFFQVFFKRFTSSVSKLVSQDIWLLRYLGKHRPYLNTTDSIESEPWKEDYTCNFIITGMGYMVPTAYMKTIESILSQQSNDITQMASLLS